ncbi:MAG: hypothetical protein WD378_05565 [Egicoccus sp.]
MSFSRPARLAGALAAVAVVAGTTGAVVHDREQAAAVERAELAAATSTLTSEVSQLRHAVAAPVHDTQQTTAALQVLVAEAITGSDRAPADVLEDVQRVTDQLRSQAERLDEAASAPLPSRSGTLPVAGLDPLFARLEPLDEQARGLAVHLRESADRVEQLAGAATHLQVAAAEYAASSGELPDGEDPDVHATAWRAELERLAVYRTAVDEAADHAALGGLADAHAGLLDALETLAADALAELEAGDIDGYNARVAAGVEDEVIATWREGLSVGADAALEAPAMDHLERSRGLTLGLVKELDNVRRSSQLAIAG